MQQCIFSIKAITRNLASFISGTSDVIFEDYFFLEHRRLQDVFLGAPSQDRARQTDCLTYALKKLVLEILLAAFLKKRMATPISST